MNRYYRMMFTAVLCGAGVIQAQTAGPHSAELKKDYMDIQSNLLKAAEKMPADDYS